MNLDKHVDGLKNYAIRLLREMISIPTTVPPGENYKEFADYAKDVLNDLGLKTEVIKVPKDVAKKYIPDMSEYPRYIVIARIGSEKPVLHFNGHYDVVPAGDGWKYDPFNATIRDKIYGRGAADMKGGIASIITAARALIDLDVELNGTLEISLTPDEEIGGMCGAKYLLDLIDAPNWTVIAEPSECEKIWIGHKGVIWGEVKVSGRTAHASTPDEGVNAVEACVKIANRLMDFKSDIEKRTTSYECNVKKAKLTITQFEGGVKINVIPDTAILKFDRRILPEENVDEAVNEIANIVNDFSRNINAKVDFNVIFAVKPSVNDGSDVASRIESIVRNIGLQASKAISSGFMDTRFFVDAGSDAVAFGPGNLSQAHAPNEFVEIDKVMLASKIFARLAADLLGRD